MRSDASTPAAYRLPKVNAVEDTTTGFGSFFLYSGNLWKARIRGVILVQMSEVTRILEAAEQGDTEASDQLLPLVYEELRKLAAAKLSQEKPGQTLQATALVHEAYLRLVDQTNTPKWESRGHFFSAAAEAMRRILVEQARKKRRLKRGGDRVRADLLDQDLAVNGAAEEILAVSDALDHLAKDDALAADVLKLRYYSGLSIEEASQALGISRANAYRHWTYARAWVRSQILDTESEK